jgi:hypothetical protein
MGFVAQILFSEPHTHTHTHTQYRNTRENNRVTLI